MKSISEIIHELREDNDLIQNDIAKMLRISRQTYSRYELGQYDLPVRYLGILADFYGVSSDYILGRAPK